MKVYKIKYITIAMEPVWKIKIRSNDKKALVDYVFDERLDTSCGGPKKIEDGIFEIEAFVKDSQKKLMTSRKTKSIDIEIYEDVIESAIKKQNDISKQNRYSKKDSKTTAENAEVKGFGVKE